MTEGSEQSEDGSTSQSASKLAVWLYGHARRVIVFVVGSTVLLIGIAMIVLPGPAFIVIPLGLAILATEFIWARKWLEYAKRRLSDVTAYAAGNSQGKGDSPRER